VVQRAEVVAHDTEATPVVQRLDETRSAGPAGR
jgi:hypothetical protein